jgi:hypothetical protein
MVSLIHLRRREKVTDYFFAVAVLGCVKPSGGGVVPMVGEGEVRNPNSEVRKKSEARNPKVSSPLKK